MSDDLPSVHNTEIKRIQNGDEGGWEFVCHSCGYRARYTMDSNGIQRLEILFAGDTTARHTNGQSTDSEVDRQPDITYYEPLDDVGLTDDDFAPDDCWIPDELKEQVEAILRKFE